MLTGRGDLVMPVANMLEAALRAAGRGDEWRTQDRATSPGAAGVDLPAAVDRRPGAGAHRVHVAPVRASRCRGRARVGPLAGAGPRRRPRTVRSQHAAA